MNDLWDKYGDNGEFDCELSFHLKDIIPIVHEIFPNGTIMKIIEINGIYTTNDSRDQGLASERLKNFISHYDDYLIISRACAMKREYPDKQPTPAQYEEMYKKLDRFYERNGFVNTTYLFQSYDGTTTQTYMYMNDIGQKLYDHQNEHDEV